MENYEEKYKHALECVQEILSGGQEKIALSRLKLRLQPFFPELVEDNDERIRKEIIAFLRSKNGYMTPNEDWDFHNRWLAWLEKQDNQKSTIRRFKIGDKVHCGDESQSITITGVRNDAYLTDSALGVILFSEEDYWEKVEPKFKPGDYIKHNKANIICKIISVNSSSYYMEKIGTNGGIELFNAEQNFHLWTIKDAKDGDVLYSIDSKQPFIYKERPQFSQARGYCCINKFGEFAIWNTSKCVISTDKYIPATKEQRDFLFSKMKEAGYEWDAEKKELKKIETASKESEDDVPHWISVEDELPKINPIDSECEYNDDVIMALKDGSIAVGRYERDNSTGEHYWMLYGVDKDLVVTHWMPLPTPPKKGK